LSTQTPYYLRADLHENVSRRQIEAIHTYPPVWKHLERGVVDFEKLRVRHAVIDQKNAVASRIPRDIRVAERLFPGFHMDNRQKNLSCRKDFPVVTDHKRISP
jgi:hypothetical protein